MSETPENNVSGLTTPHLNNGAFVDALDSAKPEDEEAQVPSALELISELDAHAKQVAELLEENDKEILSKIEALADRIERLRRRAATTPEAPKSG